MEGEPDLQPAVLLMEQGETVAEIRNNKIDIDNCDHEKKITHCKYFKQLGPVPPYGRRI